MTERKSSRMARPRPPVPESAAPAVIPPLLEQVQHAKGENVEGLDRQAVLTHTPPDPAIVDDASAPLATEE